MLPLMCDVTQHEDLGLKDIAQKKWLGYEKGTQASTNMFYTNLVATMNDGEIYIG